MNETNKLITVIALLTAGAITLAVNGNCFGKFKFTFEGQQVCMSQDHKDSITKPFLAGLKENVEPHREIGMQVAIARSDKTYLKEIGVELQKKLTKGWNQPVYEPFHKELLADPAYYAFIDGYFSAKEKLNINDMGLYQDYETAKLLKLTVKKLTESVDLTSILQ